MTTDMTIKLAESLEEIIKESLGEIDPGSINGLDSVIEGHLEHFEVDANDIKGLDDEVNGLVDEYMKECTIDADNISGLDDKISNHINDFDFDIDVENVSGLENAIEVEVERQIEDIEFSTDNVAGLPDLVESQVIEQLGLFKTNFLQGAIKTALESDAIKEILEKKVHEALGSVLQKLLMLPVAQPVTKVP